MKRNFKAIAAFLTALTLSAGTFSAVGTTAFAVENTADYAILANAPRDSEYAPKKAQYDVDDASYIERLKDSYYMPCEDMVLEALNNIVKNEDTPEEEKWYYKHVFTDIDENGKIPFTIDKQNNCNKIAVSSRLVDTELGRSDEIEAEMGKCRRFKNNLLTINWSCLESEKEYSADEINSFITKEGFKVTAYDTKVLGKRFSLRYDMNITYDEFVKTLIALHEQFGLIPNITVRSNSESYHKYYDSSYKGKYNDHYTIDSNMSQYFRDNNIIADVSSRSDSKTGLWYLLVEYFDADVKQLIDKFIEDNNYDTKDMVFKEYDENKKISLIYGKIDRFIWDNGLQAQTFTLSGDAANEPNQLLVNYLYTHEDIKDKVEKFIEDNHYNDYGIKVVYNCAGSEDSGKDGKITDGLEILARIREFIKSQDLKFVGVYANLNKLGEQPKLTICYSSSGHQPESREEGRMEKTFKAISDFAEEQNIDMSDVSYDAWDDLILEVPIDKLPDIPTAKLPITDQDTIRDMIAGFIKEYNISARVLREDEIPLDSKVAVEYYHADLEITDKINKFMQNSNIPTQSVHYIPVRLEELDNSITDLDTVKAMIEGFIKDNNIPARIVDSSELPIKDKVVVEYYYVDEDVPDRIKKFMEENNISSGTVDYLVMESAHDVEDPTSICVPTITDPDTICQMLREFMENNDIPARTEYNEKLGKKVIVYFYYNASEEDKNKVEEYIASNSIDKELVLEISETLNTTELKGDTDLNGEVGISDIVKLAKYNINNTTYAFVNELALKNADMNGDGKVDGLDTGALIEYNLKKR